MKNAGRTPDQRPAVFLDFVDSFRFVRRIILFTFDSFLCKIPPHFYDIGKNSRNLIQIFHFKF